MSVLYRIPLKYVPAIAICSNIIVFIFICFCSWILPKIYQKCSRISDNQQTQNDEIIDMGNINPNQRNFTT